MHPEGVRSGRSQAFSLEGKRNPEPGALPRATRFDPYGVKPTGSGLRDLTRRANRRVPKTRPDTRSTMSHAVPPSDEPTRRVLDAAAAPARGAREPARELVQTP